MGLIDTGYGNWAASSSDFAVLNGARISSIFGAKAGSEVVQFQTDRGVLTLYHEQDCCESVLVEDVTGDPLSLYGAIVVSATERSQVGEEGEWGESQTWTFYDVRTTQGDLTLRWLGESNGYYSESVDVHWSAA